MKAIKLNGVTYKYSVSDKKTWDYSEKLLHNGHCGCRRGLAAPFMKNSIMPRSRGITARHPERLERFTPERLTPERITLERFTPERITRTNNPNE